MFIVFQFVSESIVRMGHGISPSPCVDRTNLYKCLGLLEGKRKLAPSFQSPCKSLRRMNAFLEEKDAHVSEPVGSQNSPVPGGHMCHGEWVTDSQVEPPNDFSCHDGDDEIPQTVPQYGDDWDDTQVVEGWLCLMSFCILHMYFAMCCDCVKCHWTWWHFCWTHVMLHQHGAKLSLP